MLLPLRHCIFLVKSSVPTWINLWMTVWKINYCHGIIESQNGLSWKGPYRLSSSCTPAAGKAATHQLKAGGLSRAPSNMTLNVSRDGALTASLGSLCQCLTILWVKNFFPTSNLNFSYFSLKPFSLVLSLSNHVKSSLQVLGCFNEFSSEPSLLQAKQAQLPQPFFTGEMLLTPDHLPGPPLDQLQQLHILPVLPDLDTVLQMEL